MRYLVNFSVPTAALAVCLAAAAQTPDYQNVGRTPTDSEIQ